jgi:hypothetical protein
VREYTPREFAALFEGRGGVELFAGRAKGGEIVPLANRMSYFLVNDLYVWKPTQLLAKVAKRALGTRMWAHQAAWVEVR